METEGSLYAKYAGLPKDEWSIEDQETYKNTAKAQQELYSTYFNKVLDKET